MALRRRCYCTLSLLTSQHYCILLLLYFIFTCIIVYYCPGMGLCAGMRGRWDWTSVCLMYNVYCILYLLFCIKIVLHCHYTTPCMYWSPLGLSAHITIISEYTHNNQTKIKTSEKTFKKIPDIIWKSWEVGGDPSLDHGILNHFLTSPTDHILLTLFISHGSYLRIKKIGIPSLKGLLPNLSNPWENNAI